MLRIDFYGIIEIVKAHVYQGVFHRISTMLISELISGKYYEYRSYYQCVSIPTMAKLSIPACF